MPRPGSYEYTTRFDFSELQKFMGAYKRAKYRATQANNILKECGTALHAHASKLKVDVKMDDLSEYDPTESESD